MPSETDQIVAAHLTAAFMQTQAAARGGDTSLLDVDSVLGLYWEFVRDLALGDPGAAAPGSDLDEDDASDETVWPSDVPGGV